MQTDKLIPCIKYKHISEPLWWEYSPKNLEGTSFRTVLLFELWTVEILPNPIKLTEPTIFKITLNFRKSLRYRCQCKRILRILYRFHRDNINRTEDMQNCCKNRCIVHGNTCRMRVSFFVYTIAFEKLLIDVAYDFCPSIRYV